MPCHPRLDRGSTGVIAAHLVSSSWGSARSWLALHFPRHRLGQLDHRHGVVAAPVVAGDGVEVFPLLCPLCDGPMRLIAFITEGVQIRKVLNHIEVNSEPPHISLARGPPLWDDCDAQSDCGASLGLAGAVQRR